MVHGALAQDIRTADWSDEVAPFWGAVIKSAMSTQGLAGLFTAGWTTIKVPTSLMSTMHGDSWRPKAVETEEFAGASQPSEPLVLLLVLGRPLEHVCVELLI